MTMYQALLDTVAAMGRKDNTYWAPTANGDSKNLAAYEKYIVLDISGLTTGETADLYLCNATEAGRGAEVHVRVMTAIGSSGTFHIHSGLGDTTDINLSSITAQHEDIMCVSDGLSWQITCTDGSR